VVPQHVQSFALEFSSQGVPVPLLEELAGQVFRYAGCASAPMDELVTALHHATSGTAFGGGCRCDVQIRAGLASVDILVSANGGRVWQGSCARPPAARSEHASSAAVSAGPAHDRPTDD
jgi:hypothetical protein